MVTVGETWEEIKLPLCFLNREVAPQTAGQCHSVHHVRVLSPRCSVRPRVESKRRQISGRRCCPPTHALWPEFRPHGAEQSLSTPLHPFVSGEAANLRLPRDVTPRVSKVSFEGGREVERESHFILKSSAELFLHFKKRAL